MKWRNRDSLAGYVFTAPFVIGFLAFTLFPMISSLYFSFTKYDMLSSPKWIGFGNYKTFFMSDEKIGASMLVTFGYVLTSVPLRLIFALLIALLLNRNIRGVGFYRATYYLPSLIGGSVAVSIMWRQIFGDKGLLNALLKLVGIETHTAWIGYPQTALGTLVLLAVWQFGSSMLIFLAGLKNIPSTYYEAASVDGASGIRRFFSITLPLLSPIMLFNLIMQTITAFMTFTPVYIISNGEGGPLDHTLLYSLYLFRRAFVFFEMGYASAMAWVMLLIIALITLVLFKTSKLWVHYDGKEEA